MSSGFINYAPSLFIAFFANLPISNCPQFLSIGQFLFDYSTYVYRSNTNGACLPSFDWLDLRISLSQAPVYHPLLFFNHLGKY